MPVITPFWLKQRQVATEQVNDATLRLSGPNMSTYELVVAPAESGAGWGAALFRLSGVNGKPEPVAVNEHLLADEQTAWQVGFELFRTQVVV